MLGLGCLFKYESAAIKCSLFGGGVARSVVDRDCTVPCAASDWVELEVLLEGLTLTRCEVKALFLVVNCQEVEGRHQDDRESERNGGKTNLSCVHSAREGHTEDSKAKQVICRNKVMSILSQENLHSILSGLA